jgi:hypothetical protein
MDFSFFGIGLPVSQELQRHIEWILLPVAVQIIASLLVEWKFRGKKYAQVFVTLAGTIAVTGYTLLFLLSPVSKSVGDAIAAFIIFFVLWAALFHLVAWNYGPWLSTLTLPRWAFSLSLGNGVWVLAIDYVYLLFSSLGILRIVLGLATANPGLQSVNVFAALFLGIGIAIRITKTTIEIARWDQPAPAKR